ncbi:MAG: potassium channel family protein [Nanoarchaeota archaeon]
MGRQDFITLNEMFSRIRKMNRFYTFIDRLTFIHILILWASIIIIFGISYHFFSSADSYLLFSQSKVKVVTLMDSIYFSFITATSTGFGDIIPGGSFKLVSIFEVVFGLLLLAFVTSKLVSIKQNVILGEIYEISFTERLSRLRSSLLLFRQNIDRILDKLENKNVRKREITGLYILLSQLEGNLNEVYSFFGKKRKEGFVKAIDNVNSMLIFNSTLKSLEKLSELLRALNESNMEWKRDITITMINSCLGITDSLFGKLTDMKELRKEDVLDLQNQKAVVIDSIRKEVG